jgi:tripartite-type tricarboxylate transporter receptor subunit TctC
MERSDIRDRRPAFRFAQCGLRTQANRQQRKRIMLRTKVIHAIAALAAIVLLAAAQPAAAQTYPASRITIVCAFAPGGFADTMARVVAQGLSERLHQSVVVENRGGAGGNIAAGLVAHAAADGYTILATTTAIAINDTLMKSKQYAARDLKTVAMVASSPETLSVNASNPVNDLPAFIKAMNGKTINFASAGIGTGSHIEAEYFFKFLAKVPVQHIPFQGGAPAVNAMLANQVDLLAGTLAGSIAGQLQAGRLKGLGVAADKRAAAVPDVPTYAEQGFPNFTASSWVGLFVPAATDAKILGVLNDAINATMKGEDVQRKLIALGFDPIVASQADADKTFNDEVAKWGRMVQALNLSIN